MHIDFGNSKFFFFEKVTFLILPVFSTNCLIETPLPVPIPIIPTNFFLIKVPYTLATSSTLIKSLTELPLLNIVKFHNKKPQTKETYEFYKTKFISKAHVIHLFTTSLKNFISSNALGRQTDRSFQADESGKTRAFEESLDDEKFLKELE